MARVKIDGARLTIKVTRFSSRIIRQVLRELEEGARIRAAHGPYATGRLASSIRSTGPIPAGFRVLGTVSSDLPYAAAAQSGARPHIIRGRGDYRLKFFWRRVGRVVYPWYVRHPGQPGKHYLTETLVQVARRHNMKVRITDF